MATLNLRINARGQRAREIEQLVICGEERYRAVVSLCLSGYAVQGLDAAPPPLA